MRADTAFRFVSVNAFLARPLATAGFGFAGLANLVCLDDASAPTALDNFLVIALDAPRFGGVVEAISMPNISERSQLASTFALAGPLRVFERSDPALAIKSC